MPRQKRYQERIAYLEQEHKRFIIKEDKLTFFIGLFQRIQVEANQVWQIYRDGVFFKQLIPGPHFLWKLWHRWRYQIINLRVILLDIEAEGRVKGPQVPDSTPGAKSIDLACDVVAQFQLACKIADIQKFLQFEKPLTVFYASFYDMVYEIIGKLPYDQYAAWATSLRDIVRSRLQGGDKDPLRLIGLKIEEVYVTDVAPNEETDANMLAMYRLVEQARRELVEAQNNTLRDREVYRSYREKGEIINIAPSILALQNSPIGEQLIGSDAELRRLMVAAGLNPSVNIQPIADPHNPLNAISTSTIGYLQPPQREQPPAGNGQPLSGPGGGNTGPMFPPLRGGGGAPSGPILPPSGGNPSGSMFPVHGQSPFHDQPTQANAPTNPYGQPEFPSQQPVVEGQPVAPMRQEQELQELQAAGFLCTGRGQNTPAFDSNGLPVAGSTEWLLDVYVRRPGGFLTIIFHCPVGYPMIAPKVQVKPLRGGGLQWVFPNTTEEWHPGRLLVEVAKELNENIPD